MSINNKKIQEEFTKTVSKRNIVTKKDQQKQHLTNKEKEFMGLPSSYLRKSSNFALFA